MVRRHLAVFCVLTIFTIFLVSLSDAHASEDLVRNGGFEDGKFTSWSVSKSYVVMNSKNEPSHSGKYSARLGTTQSEGRIAQTVAVPPNSRGRFMAWYRVEKGAMLTIALKNIDGSIIERWSVAILTSWTPVTYDLDLSHAGQSVVIEFVGATNAEPFIETGMCIDLYTGNYYPCSLTEYVTYFAYIDDVSMTYTTTYEANVGVVGLPPGLDTTVSVDGVTTATMSSEESRALTFTIGDSHTVSVEKYVNVDNVTRYYCESNSATISTDGATVFEYRLQYYLSVSSPYGATTGSQWYDADSLASFSVEPTSKPLDGFFGDLGAKYVFEGWSGDVNENSPTTEVRMDGPKSVTAAWKTDYTPAYVSMLLVACPSSGAFAGYAVWRRRRAAAKHATIAPPVGGVVPWSAEDGAAPDEASDFTRVYDETGGHLDAQDGATEQELLSLIDGLGKAHSEGTVPEEVFLRLREDYEKRLARKRGLQSS